MRRVLIALLVLNGLLLPLAALPLLFLANAVNPLQLAFITSFTVENRMPARVLVTPVGAVGPEGERHPLPLARRPWLLGGSAPLLSFAALLAWYRKCRHPGGGAGAVAASRR